MEAYRLNRTLTVVVPFNPMDHLPQHHDAAIWLRRLLGRAGGATTPHGAVGIGRVVTTADRWGTGRTQQTTALQLRLMGEQWVLPMGSDTSRWLCVDPVALIADRYQLRLIPPARLHITQPEADALVVACNELLQDEGVKICCPHPQRWYLEHTKPLELYSRSPDEVAVASLRDQMPTGSDARWWRQRSAELEMLLFSHPVNEARGQRGELPISGLWPWGGHNIEIPCGWDTIIGDGVVAQGMAQLCDAQQLPAAVGAAVRLGSQSLVIVDGDIDDHHSAYTVATTIVEQWIQPLYQRLMAGEVDQIHLLLSDGYHYRLTRSQRWCFWRRPLSPTRGR